MNKVFISLVVLFFGLGTILVFMAMQTNTASVFTPSELSKAAANHSIPRVRVVGKVAAEKLEYQTEPAIKLTFQIEDPEGDAHGKVAVSYNKLMPDMFAPGRSVIIDGQFRDGIVYADSLMTQCPSKYEPPSPTKTTDAPKVQSDPYNRYKPEVGTGMSEG
ncbi:MAG: cytochrome c maturation protein CcmE [Bdellovibrionales bacterium]|nr:cytochrome c maturation protein CcmE [Bdellovibrionales bacterium]